MVILTMEAIIAKTKKTGLFFTFLFLLNVSYILAQPVAEITVEAGQTDRYNTPVFVDVTDFKLSESCVFVLEEENGKGKTVVDCQLERTPYGERLWWILEGDTKAGSRRTFLLSIAEAKVAAPRTTAVDKDGALVFFKDDSRVLQYNYATTYPPEGVDTIYRRSGFIHPVWSPSGMTLTQIQPHDHYHHYGIWNPWTKVKFEDNTHDFWNLIFRSGTVRFENFSSVVNGDVFAEAKVIHHHIVFPDSEKEKNALREECDIRLWNTGRDGVFVWDFTSILNCATSSPFIIEAYRYAGFGFRATAEWGRDNCTMLTSEGKTRKDADGSLARWAYVTGKTQEDHNGLLFLGYPANFNYPEPIRIWDENAGEYFFNFAPTKTKDWHILPGSDYRLKYRIVIFQGDMTVERAEQYWQDFAYPPKATIKVKK